MNGTLQILLTLALVPLVTTLVCAGIRLVRGPSLLDRIIAFDVIAVGAVGILLVLSALWRTDVFIELVLVYTLLGFFSTVAFVSYLGRSRATGKPMGEVDEH